MNEFKLINDLSAVIPANTNAEAYAESLDSAKKFFNDQLDAVESDAHNILKQLPELREKVNDAPHILRLIAIVLEMVAVFDELEVLDMKG